MKKLQTVSFGVVTIFILVSCSLFTPKGSQNDSKLGNVNPSVADFPVLDLEGPLPSPGAALLKAQALDEPGIAALISDLEAAEQATLKAAVADLQAKMNTSSNALIFASLESSPPMISTFLIPSSAKQSAIGRVLIVNNPKSSVNQPAEGGLSAASIIALLSSSFTDLFIITAAFPVQSSTYTEKEGSVTTKTSIDFGKSEDGSSHFGLGLQSEGTKNGTAVKTEISAVIDGQRCPTAEGQVSFSVKARIGSELGGTGTTQDLTTFVRAVVNDDAEIASTTFDLIQGTTQAKGGRTVYLETGETIKYGQDFKEYKESNIRINQKTDNVTQEDINKLEPPGLKAALELGLASLMSAQNAWQSGKCVKIEAPSPGKVEPGSTTPIPVKVVSIFDGADAPSKLKAALTGAESIDPTTLAKTPGTLTYTAPNEKGKSATILLTATSKRGKATLELNANTGEKKQTYHVIETPGAGGSWSGGCIDDLSKPFSVSFTGPGTTATYTISPSSSTSGSLVEKQHVALSGTTMDIEGKGSYTIIPTDKDPEGNLVGMEIVFSTTGKAKTCVGGECVTTKIDSGKGVQIPLRVQDEPCP
jgi:hypothetical protein